MYPTSQLRHPSHPPKWFPLESIFFKQSWNASCEIDSKYVEPLFPSHLDELSRGGGEHHVGSREWFVGPVLVGRVVRCPNVSKHFVHNFWEALSVPIEIDCIPEVDHVLHLLLHYEDFLVSPGSTRGSRYVRGSLLWTEDRNLSNGESSPLSTFASVSLQNQIAAKGSEVRVWLKLKTLKWIM